jgi:hypothetical protein
MLDDERLVELHPELERSDLLGLPARKSSPG